MDLYFVHSIMRRSIHEYALFVFLNPKFLSLLFWVKIFCFHFFLLCCSEDVVTNCKYHKVVVKGAKVNPFESFGESVEEEPYTG